ncbi:hypothetical protein DL767_002905 [Monosporascus sp. MG133]|nr:hypothetical protein DL767_002905 [Monosporascus sp. MG133]
MAGLAHDFSLPNSSFFNIINDGPVTTASPTLLGGACNFVDLNGTNGPKCGCRRFWSRGASLRPDRGSPTGQSHGFSGGDAAGAVDSAAFCMCSHHACYHDDIREAQAPVTTNVPAVPNNGQENERPRATREPLTPFLPETSFPMPLQTGQPMDVHMCNPKAPSFSTQFPDANAGRAVVAASACEETLPDTLSWNNFIQSQPDQGPKLAPIPSQCLIPSQPSSTTSSTRIGYLRPFAGKGLHTLSGVKSKLREPLLEEDEETIPVDEDPPEPSVDQSVDDLATVANTPRSSRHTDATVRNTQASPSKADSEALRELSNTVQSHEQRLDRLENPSFSAVGHDECHDKHDQADLRVTDVEYRVTELEKLLNDSSSHASVSRRLHPNDSASSVASVSTAGSRLILDRAELYNELQSLKAQLSQLQGISSFTSYTNPWEIEVVFLPFPLKGVWVETRDFNISQRAPGGSFLDADQWTQMPNSSSALEPQSPGWNEWAGPEFDTDWLLPRACAPDRMIDRRLRSRGLVKKVAVRGPDARSVQQAVYEAFGTLFRTFSRMQANVHHGSTMHQRVHKFLGLQHPWVPLRKLHKDSRLRFLSPAEMVTPVAWDVQFLSSSVVMKATGVHRLFITHPEAYLQDQDAYDNGWSWQRLRELSRVYPDSQTSQEVPEADAMEDCWEWNDRLDDQPLSANNSQSLSMRQVPLTRLRTTSFSPAPHMFAGYPAVAGAHFRRSGSPRVMGRVEARKASKPPYIRTSSMPPNAPHVVSPAQAYRRVSSFAHPRERHSSPLVTRPVTVTTHAIAVANRARSRSTRSPSLKPPSIRPRNTPRWSTSSPSPVPEMAMRAMTPYYATPYSNAPFTDSRSARGGVIVYDDNDFEERGSGTDPYDEGEGADDESEYHDSPMVDLAQQHGAELLHPPHDSMAESESWQDGRPEDEPWPGIEDAENRDPGSSGFHDIDIHVDDDAMSDANDGASAGGQSRESSAPSEYPSTQRAWTAAAGEEAFRVFEDGDGGK